MSPVGYDLMLVKPFDPQCCLTHMQVHITLKQPEPAEFSSRAARSTEGVGVKVGVTLDISSMS